MNSYYTETPVTVYGNLFYNLSFNDQGTWSSDLSVNIRTLDEILDEVERDIILSEPKFSIGTKVKISTTDRRSNGKTGVIVDYEPEGDYPYVVEMDQNDSEFSNLDFESYLETELTQIK